MLKQRSWVIQHAKLDEDEAIYYMGNEGYNTIIE